MSALVTLSGGDDELDERVPRLLPLMHHFRHDYGDDGRWSTSDEAVHQLMDVYMGVGWNDDWSIEFVPPSEVHLRAPRDAHERFARLVNVFENAAFDVAGVIVHRFSGPRDLPSGIVGRDALAAALRAASIEPRTHSVALPPRQVARLADTRSHTACIAVNVEIAQAATVHLGQVQEILSGLQLEMTAVPTRAGIRLDYSLRSTTPTSTEDVEGAACIVQYFGQEHGRVVDASRTWRETFALAGGGAFGSATIGSDEVLVLRVGAEGDGAEYCAVQLDPAKRTTASVSRVELGEGYVAEIVPAESVQPMMLRARGRIFSKPSVMSWHAGNLEETEECILGARREWSDSERFDRLMNGLEMAERLDVGGSTVVIVTEEGRGVLDRLLDIESQLAQPRLRVQVTADGGAVDGALVGTYVTDGGTQSAIVVGGERLETQYSEVEVAQSSSATVPVVTTRFEGLALAATLQPLSSGRLGYRLTGQYSAPISRQQGRANLLGGSGLDATVSEHLVIDERGVAESAGDGVWRIVLGDRAGKGARVVLDVRAER
jgi:hypothetical protein